MQNTFIVPAMQHACRAKPLSALAIFSSLRSKAKTDGDSLRSFSGASRYLRVYIEIWLVHLIGSFDYLCPFDWLEW